ncbi:hypothetical protein NMG60_11005394 [Bertholletia excelsa]
MAKGTLEVLLVEAQGIESRDSIFSCLPCFNSCNEREVRPYVLVQYRNQESTSSPAEQEGKKHVWNENMKFDVDYKPDTEDDHNAHHKLILRVMDQHKLSEDEYIGETTIYVKDVLSLGVEKGEEKLGVQRYRIVRPDNSYSGEISVAVTFTLRLTIEIVENPLKTL